jgi:hypothetical protein
MLSASTAAAVVLVDNSTQGLYNEGIGQSLNGTNPFDGTFLFPNNDSDPDDPFIDAPPAPEPDLSTAAGALGNWLSDPAAPGGTWSAAPQAIPTTWAINDETAIIYQLDGGGAGLQNVVASFGVDNGIFVWLNGSFLGGQLRPGEAFPGELVLNIGDLGPGPNYLQVLREDHGGATGYDVSVTATVIPLPAGLPLLLSALGFLGLMLLPRLRRAE